MTDSRDKGAGDKSPWARSLAKAKGAAVADDGSMSPPGTFPADSSTPSESSPPAKGSIPADGSPRRQDPLHGITLKMIVTRLEAHYGWAELGRRIPINCFLSEPSVASSLKFLRRTPWAREKVEGLYLKTLVLHDEAGE